MSNVKFKFWTGTEMLTEGFFINPDGTVWAWVDYRHTNSFVLKGQLIQYTGLKDKNGTGKEIYDGCLFLNGSKKEYGVVTMEYGQWVVKFKEYQYPLYEYLKNDPERESIGNKFQNHELLSNG